MNTRRGGRLGGSCSERPTAATAWVGAAAALLLGTAAAGATGCGHEEPMPPPDPTDPTAVLFDPAHVVEVAITMPPADWDALRYQTRDLLDILGGQCLAEPFPSPFTYFMGNVTVDGEARTDVGVRKKGFLGSLDDVKPSLKLKFDEYVLDGSLYGLDRLTLNNSKQDPSFVHQCLAYAVFAEAGLASPRCNFAHVTVNGEDMGLYVNVESVDKDFLKRWYADEDGNLYEGTLSDFRPEWINTFDKKTNEMDPDRSDLDLVVAALDDATVSDAALYDSVSSVVDLDEFFTFWATEVIIHHWDGYANNTNNFYVYHDPTIDRFVFMPWGVDGVFQPDPFAGGMQPPTSVYATGVLARRLYLAPDTQAMYLDRLRSVLDDAWHENAMQAEIDRMEALITPVIEAAGGAAAVDQAAGAIDEARDFVTTRRGAILAEINAGTPAWTAPLRDPPCFDVIGDTSGTFSTTFGTVNAPNPFATGSGTLTGTLNMVALGPYTSMGATSGFDPNDTTGNPPATVTLFGMRADGTIDLAFLSIDPALFAGGTAVPLDWGAAFGALAHFDPATMSFTVTGYIFNGVVQLDEGATVMDAPVSGSFSGQVVFF
ncbi:MAG TPA: CotH kinase family protein [Myxococcota bacterium]|jgi:spore coat protein CotH|nr:CotH kinase family protein [Myxococcota bacterium]